MTEAVDVDVRSSVAGQRFGGSVDVSGGSVRGEEKGNMLRKEKHGRAMSLAEMSEKFKEMLRKMHIGKKAEK